MVLPAPTPDAQPGPAVAPWIEGIRRVLRLIERGILVLVDRANDAQLGPLVRALCAEHPDLLVITEAPRIEDAPHGAVIVLATRPEDAGWLNMARPIFGERALRVILWSKAETTADLARRAPDFFDWIARRFECPAAPPAFAVAGLRAALKAKAWAVAWQGRGLEEAFAVALPGRALVRASAAVPDEEINKIARRAGRSWIVWSNLPDEESLRRLRWSLRWAGRRGRNILDNPRSGPGDAWPVHDTIMDLGEAVRTLETAGVASAGRLAALLDLEPEAIALAVEQVRGGVQSTEVEAIVLRTADPGAAVGRLAGERGVFDPVLVAAFGVPVPVVRAFAVDPRVKQARAGLVGYAHRGSTGMDGGQTLPPLIIESGPDGAREFERLVQQLLRVHADRYRFDYTSVIGTEGANGIARDGLPGLDGTVLFQILWTPEDIREHDPAERIRLDITRTIFGGARHWILITPRDFPPAEEAWLRSLDHRSDLTLHHWGHAKLIELLRECPALFARYYPQAARPCLPGYDGTDFITLATRYRKNVGLVHNRLRTIGIPPEVRPREGRVELPLNKLFIPLRLTPEESGAAPRTLASVLSDSQSVVVLADPGMGKSTLLAYVALVFAGGASLEGFTPPTRIVPIHISLRDFVRRQKDRPGLSFLEYLELEARELHSLAEAHRAFFEATLRMGEALLLLDGLDEVGNETARHNVATAIRTFQAEYSDCRFWITSRIYGYTDNVRLPMSFAHYRINQFDDAQIDDFIGRWYDQQFLATPQEVAEQAASLRDAVHRTPSIRRLAGNPLLLTLMAFIQHGRGKLPRERGELYDKCVEMLLKTWLDGKRGDSEAARVVEGLTLNVPTQKDYLAHLAFFVQQKNQGGKDDETRGLVSRGEAIEALSSRHFSRAQRERPALTAIEARDEMARFLDSVCGETGLVLDRGNDQLSFIHLSFQEYLAAWVFLCGTDVPKGPAFFVKHLGDPAWEEVLLLRLYVVLSGGGGGETEFDQILGAVLRSLERKSVPEGWLTLVRAIRDDLALTERDRKEILGRAIGYWLEAPTFEGVWFNALEEVKIFTERARAMLHSVIAEGRAHARKAADAVALLHLETRLFGFPEDAVDLLRQRADLVEMLADLVVFVDEPAVRRLLAEKATVADWSRALRALDGPQVYQMTVRWMKGAADPAAADAATALLWSKSLADFRSRAAFAEGRRGHENAALFERSGTLTWEAPFSSAMVPYAALRALPAAIPSTVTWPAAAVLCPLLARKRLEESAAADPWVAVKDWTAAVIVAALNRFPTPAPLPREAVTDLAALFARGFSEWFVRCVELEFGRGFATKFGLDFGSSFVSSLGMAVVRHFGEDFGRAFGCGIGRYFVADFGHAFINAFADNFGRPLVRDFGDDSETPGWAERWERSLEDERVRTRLLKSERFWFWAAYDRLHLSLRSQYSTMVLEQTLQNPLALPLLMANIWSAAASHTILISLRSAVTAHPDGKVPIGELEAWLLRNPIDAYATALAWQEYGKYNGDSASPEGALLISHAAYASLMTGIECKLPVAPDLGDSRVRLAYLFHEICNFRDAASNIRKLEAEIASPTPELRPLLEAAGLLAPAALADEPSPQPARIQSTPEPTPEPDPALFTWLHLSDIHFGHHDATRLWDQRLVLDTLHKDIAARRDRDIPTPDAILITGDIAYSGASAEYEAARSWLLNLASSLDLAPDRIFLVPGNHDIDRTVDTTNRNASRLLRGLRDGDDLLDESLADPVDRALLTSRLAPYLSFAGSLRATAATEDPLRWSHALTAAGLPVRIVGLSTPLLSAAGDIDHGKLRLGNAALAALADADRSRELVLVLTHHPLRGGWLADQRDADRWIQSRAHVHLFGHVHEADSEEARSGTGSGLIRIAAGAAYGDRPGAPAGHGYSIAAVVPADDGSLRLRIWPRRWSDTKKAFTVDVNNTPEARPCAEHSLPGLKVPRP